MPIFWKMILCQKKCSARVVWRLKFQFFYSPHRHFRCNQIKNQLQIVIMIITIIVALPCHPRKCNAQAYIPDLCDTCSVFDCITCNECDENTFSGLSTYILRNQVSVNEWFNDDGLGYAFFSFPSTLNRALSWFFYYCCCVRVHKRANEHYMHNTDFSAYRTKTRNFLFKRSFTNLLIFTEEDSIKCLENSTKKVISSRGEKKPTEEVAIRKCRSMIAPGLGLGLNVNNVFKNNEFYRQFLQEIDREYAANKTG